MNYDDMHNALKAAAQAMHDLKDCDTALLEGTTEDTELHIENLLVSFGEFLNTLAMIGEPEEDFGNFMRNLEPKTFGHIIMQFKLCGLVGNDEQIIETLNKHAALDVAEVLGPDYGQALYRFAVAVTRMA